MRARRLGKEEKVSSSVTHWNLSAPTFISKLFPISSTHSCLFIAPWKGFLGNNDKWFVKQRQRKGQRESTTFPLWTPKPGPSWIGLALIVVEVLFIPNEGEAQYLEA